MGFVRKRANERRFVERAENPDDERLRGGFGEGVDGGDDEAGDLGSGDSGSEEIDDEDARGDEEDIAGGVEGIAVVGGEVGGDFGDRVGVEVVEELGFEGRGVRREDEEGALRRSVEEEKGGDEFGEGEAGGENHEAGAVRWVVQEIGDYVLVELDHFGLLGLVTN